MNKLTNCLFLALYFLLSGCTVYTEKQTQAVSQNVYATNDAISKARIDLAQFYSNETTRFIKPPKHPIKINSIYQAGEVVKNGEKAEKTRVVIVPDQYKNDKIVVVGSNDYNRLLQDSEIKKQLEEDNKNKDHQLKNNDKELLKQKEMSDKMIIDLNSMQKKLVQKDLVILKLWVALVSTLIIFAGAVYLRIKGVL
jgi:hypothetical protein